MNELEFMKLTRTVMRLVSRYGSTVAQLSVDDLNVLVEAEADNGYDRETRLVLKVLAENELVRR